MACASASAASAIQISSGPSKLDQSSGESQMSVPRRPAAISRRSSTVDRGGADQLLQARLAVRLATHDRHRAERAGIAAAAGKQAAVEHDAAADEGADIEIGEVAIGCAGAEGELGGAGRGRVVAEADRPGAKRRDSSAATSKSRHCAERARRRLEIGLPVPQLERHRDAEAADPAVLRGGQFGQRGSASRVRRRRGCPAARDRDRSCGVARGCRR